jgi:hypothetical protein
MHLKETNFPIASFETWYCSKPEASKAGVPSSSSVCQILYQWSKVAKEQALLLSSQHWMETKKIQYIRNIPHADANYINCFLHVPQYTHKMLLISDPHRIRQSLLRSSDLVAVLQQGKVMVLFKNRNGSTIGRPKWWFNS